MKSSFLPALAAITPALAGFDTWAPAGPYEVRGPCPMLNTLTNHGFLPHDGRNISREVTENALFDALNINKTLGSFLFDFAITTNPIENATTFSLNDLGNHGVLEHDASLSRSDAYFGNTINFNQSIFDETRSYWVGDTINIQMAANARLARFKTSMATNPDFSMSELGRNFGFGESAAYIVVIGDKETGTVPKAWVEWVFQHEQLPLHLGWKRPAGLFQEDDLGRWMDELERVTNATESGEGCPVAKQARRGARPPRSHFGF
ncbi:Chloroperoxidase [Dichotomopilus funicola]|uniref:Chloroperoxidase n=1 Tax=Dichotomopilus funicola TaxID=1934379 RepID=A0AAN6V8F7_9PEZI|nr:Chloroperoxidase [Dichotomopilus funicola]